MTIIADRQLYASPPQGQVRSRAGGQSFAARIEAGDRAKDILQDRALGFSEAGLLGLHYAQESSNNAAGQSVRKSATASTPEAMVPNGAKLVDRAAVIADNKMISTSMSRNSVQTSSNTDATGSNRSLQNLAPSSFSLEVMVVGADGTASELLSPVSKLFQKAISQIRPDNKFGLKVIETRDGISVICEDSGVSEAEIQEFNDLAQQIAKDFGVTIRRLVVNGKNCV